MGLLTPGAAARAGSRRGGFAVGAALLLALGAAAAAPAMETDQFYGWGRTLQDATLVLNARVNLELFGLVDELNREGANPGCQDVRSRFIKRLRMLFFNRLETWSVNSPLVDRSPSGPDERQEYAENTIYRTMTVLDTGSWMPPSPTVEVNGVRLGTDKLTHMLGTGWYYHRWYRRLRERGATPEEAERVAVRRGLRAENTILGRLASGVLSPGDLEANYQGMWFYEQLCAGDDPTLVREEGMWRLRRPFDLSRHVSPEWDESYQPNIYTRRKWAKVKPLLLAYCPLLEHPQVREMRAAYRERDTVTLTEELINRMVAAGKLPDPSDYSIEAVCRGAAR